MDKRDFVPFKRVGTTISPKISGDGINVDGPYQGTILNNQMTSKAAFDILSLMTDPRLLYMQWEAPGSGTVHDLSGQGHDGTYEGTMTDGDRVEQGMGWALDFDGTDDYIDLGDDDDFSFGNGAADEAVTWFGVIEIIPSAGLQMIIAKRDRTTGSESEEYCVNLSSAEILELYQKDESEDVAVIRSSDHVLSTGLHSYVISSPGDGGATAMNNVKMYIDGALVASTASNNASYVAMENTATSLLIGARKGTGGGAERFFLGDNALTGMDGSEWSAFDIHRFHQICKGLYGL